MSVNEIVFVFMIFIYCSFFLTSPLTMLGVGSAEGPQGRVGIGHR